MFHVRARQLPFKLCNLVQRHNTHSSNRSDSTASDTAEDGAKSINNINNSTLNDASNVERTPSINAETRQGKSAGPSAVRKGSTTALTPPKAPKEVSEVRIPVPWGHIAGKWWGSKNVQPIIGLHGWQDNAGTWDPLAPYLSPDISLLAVDLPGHGQSSHFHPGCGYHFLEYVAFVRRIVDYYRWQSISFLSHSLGSIIAYTYSALYQEAVKDYIAIDAMQFFTYRPDSCARNWGRFIDQLIKTDSYDKSKIPTYSYEEAVEILFVGQRGWLTRESCHSLLKRGLVKTDAGRYYFSRDPRVKIGQLQLVSLSRETSGVFSSGLRCRVLNITASNGLIYDTSESIARTYDAVRRAAKWYEHHVVEGTHQVQLNNPERVAPIINDFLKGQKVLLN